MSEDVTLASVAALIEDDTARGILAATSERPMSVTELEARLDASDATIYRRIEDLQAAGLLADRTQPDPKGHHHKEYAARLSRLTVELEDGTFEFHVERTEPMADAFTRLIEDL